MKKVPVRRRALPPPSASTEQHGPALLPAEVPVPDLPTSQHGPALLPAEAPLLNILELRCGIISQLDSFTDKPFVIECSNRSTADVREDRVDW